MKFKDRSKEEKKQVIVVSFLVIVLLLVSVIGPLVFPGTKFADIINNSVGKFFNLFAFFENNYVIIIESLTIVFFMWLLNKLILIIVSFFKQKSFRSETITNLVKSTIKYLSVILAFFLILSAWGVQTPTLLAGAGIIGLALSFGAQSLIEDIFSGLFIIFEKQYSIGDIVEVNEFRGVVKEIGLRVTKFEDLNGDIKVINNSDIRGAINTTSSLSPAICDITISYDEDIERVEKIINDNLENIKAKVESIVEGPRYIGVQKLADSSVVLRVVASCAEGDKFKAMRGMNRELKLLFDKHKIVIPYPQLVIHREEKA